MLKKIAMYALITFTFLVVLFVLGPRVPIDQTLHSQSVPDDPAKLDAYLKAEEGKFKDIRPKCEKAIAWASDKKVQTPISIVYIHGFSASRQEVAPLCDQLGKAIGANVFYTRLAGHGRSNKAMAEASVNAWLNDTMEAFKIGKVLGKKVIIVATSTGATLATWLATQVDSPEVMAYVMMSPNFAPANAQARILLLPWGATLARMLVGKERSWKPANPTQAKYWTHRYPVEALLPMMGLVKLVEGAKMSDFKAPVLIMYSPEDTVISIPKIKENFPQIAASHKKLLEVKPGQNPSKHVLAGDIVAKHTTSLVLQHTQEFLAPLLKKHNVPTTARPAAPSPDAKDAPDAKAAPRKKAAPRTKTTPRKP